MSKQKRVGSRKKEREGKKNGSLHGFNPGSKKYH
jgi:hypothetical protein